MNKRKIIVRIVQILIIIITYIVTKKAIHYARVIRGYDAIGGEYMIPILGFLTVLIIEDIYEEYEKRIKAKNKKRKKKELSIQNSNRNR